ncbi:methyltransferase domain-containing protein [Nocardioides sp. SR21]|uniref:class I SAM-dependent methyltransferase n=1 Tax=Nocardioides sp. SR21 TaxID=2919501 RepID=UPI001FAA7379|nr:methyltransferase domain-containing protein [Nocardioides sp. SR21]
MFADDYPRFIELSESTPEWQDHRPNRRSASEQRSRMNERYEALFASNRDILEGARVLDLASHDGRYSFAALKTGAAHVTGVEVRQSLIDRAQEAFAFYGQDPATYRFVCGDMFEVLAREKFDVDVVLCFGFLYHTYRHTELMYRLHNLAPRHLIVDTMVTRETRRTLKVIRERDVEDIRSAAQDAWAVRQVLVLRPSVPALRMLLRSYGFEIESMYDWKGRLNGRPPVPGVDGYAKGTRVSLRCRSREPAITPGWERVATLPTAVGPRPHKGGRKPSPTPPPAQSAGEWRERVNKMLAKATGYELRRASTKR